MNKWLWSCILCIAAVIPGFGQEYYAEKIELPGSDLGNFYKIDEGVYRSDQPSASDFKALERYGIREVLNLRNYHSDDDEAKGTSLVLHRLKTKAGRISEEELTAALRIIRDRQGPILIHCWHGSDRTGTVVAMYRIVFQGVPKEETIRELTEGGFGYHKIYDNIPKTIRRADVDRIKRELGIR